MDFIFILRIKAQTIINILKTYYALDLPYRLQTNSDLDYNQYKVQEVYHYSLLQQAEFLQVHTFSHITIYMNGLINHCVHPPRDIFRTNITQQIIFCCGVQGLDVTSKRRNRKSMIILSLYGTKRIEVCELVFVQMCHINMYQCILRNTTSHLLDKKTIYLYLYNVS